MLDVATGTRRQEAAGNSAFLTFSRRAPSFKLSSFDAEDDAEAPEPLPQPEQAALFKLLGRMAAVPSSSPCNLFQKAFLFLLRSRAVPLLRRNNESSGGAGVGGGGGGDSFECLEPTNAELYIRKSEAVI